MRYILSSCGHRRILHLARSGVLDQPVPESDVETRTLCAVFARGVFDADEASAARLASLEARGLIEVVGTEVDAAAARLRYDRNPLEHLRRVVFEYTTVCNLDCLHCRNGALEATATTDPLALRRVVDAVLPLGIDRFDFIGGEVTLYGKGWLELVRYARDHAARHTSVVTSGWFLGERDFLAAGQRYADDTAYFSALVQAGVTHVVYSLDGPEEVHDHTRRVPGLYRRILDAFQRTRHAGLTVGVSLVVGLTGERATPWLAEISRLVYGDSGTETEQAHRLLGDDANYVSNLVDVGGASNLVQLGGTGSGLAAMSDEQLRCKNFFRPLPTLRIKASGEISLCPLVEGGDGYGNVRDGDVTDLLNHLADALVFRLHAERRIGACRRFVDEEIFSGALAHPCSARVALNMIARGMADRGIRPDDVEALRALNLEVAGKMGVRPRPDMRNRAIGHART